MTVAHRLDEDDRRAREAHSRPVVHTDAYTAGQLAQRRHEPVEATLAWIEARRLLVVEHHGKQLLPAVQFDTHLDVDDQVVDAVGRLRETGWSPWACWAWFYKDSPTGESPVSMLARDDIEQFDAAVDQAAVS
jgi:hypothetical protein